MDSIEGRVPEGRVPEGRVPGQYSSFLDQAPKRGGNKGNIFSSKPASLRDETESEAEDDLFSGLGDSLKQKQKQPVRNMTLPDKVSFEDFLEWVVNPTDANTRILKHRDNDVEDVAFTNSQELAAKVAAKPRLWAYVLRKIAVHINDTDEIIAQRALDVDRLRDQLRSRADDVECARCAEHEDEINVLNSQNAGAEAAAQKIPALEKKVEDYAQYTTNLESRIERRDANIVLLTSQLGDATTQVTQLESQVKRLEEGRRGRSVSFQPDPTRRQRDFTPVDDARDRRPPPARPSSPTRSVATTSASTGHGHHFRKIADPEKFKGDKSKYPRWKTSMKMKIRREYENDDMGAIEYIVDRTEGAPYDRLEVRFPWEGVANPYSTPDECWADLDKHYKERDEMAQSMVKFKDCKQTAAETFQAFHARWEPLSLKVGYPPRLLFEDLKEKLNNRYFNEINKDISLTTVDEVVEKCHKLEYSFMKGDARYGTEKKTSKASTDSSSRKKTDKTGGASATATPRRARNSIPMPAQFRNLPPLTTNLKSQLSEEGKCFSCRQAGHESWQETCPLKVWRKANDDAAAAAAGGSSMALNAARAVNPGQQPQQLQIEAPAASQEN